MAIIHYKHKIIPTEDCLTLSNKINCNYFKSVTELIDSWYNGRKSFEIMTSGSTGKPKPIVFSREQCIKSARQTIDIFGLRNNDNFLCCLNISYVAGFMMIIRALVADANIYLTKAERNPFIKTDENVKFDFAAFVPYQLQSIIDETLQNISRLDLLKAIIVGGDSVSDKNVETFKKISAPVFHTYGMTETLTHVALKRINSDNPDLNFKAIPGLTFFIDSRNCLVIKTPITDHDIITNDIVNLISDSEFGYLGRIDNVITSAGFKIHTEVLEQSISGVINNIFQTTNFLVFAVRDEKFGQHPELVIEALGSEKKQNKLLKYFKAELHPYEIPKKVHFVEKFEFTTTGKVDRGRTVKKLFA